MTSRFTLEDEWASGRPTGLEHKHSRQREQPVQKREDKRERGTFGSFIFVYITLVCSEHSRNIGFILVTTQGGRVHLWEKAPRHRRPEFTLQSQDLHQGSLQTPEAVLLLREFRKAGTQCVPGQGGGAGPGPEM